MKKSIILLLTFIALCGCQKTVDNPSPSPSIPSQQTTNTFIPEKTAIPTAIPEYTAIPTMIPTILSTATPEISYQPIQVTYEPIQTEEPSVITTSKPINHTPKLDLSEWGDTVIELKENEIISFTKKIKAIDEDGNALIYSIAKAAGSQSLQTIDSPYANISISRDGTISYELKEIIASLSAEETVVDFFMIRASDGTNHAEVLITVNITGSNSTPSLTEQLAHNPLSVPNRDEKSTYGKLLIHDPDSDSLENVGHWKIEEMIYSTNEGTIISEKQDQWRFTLSADGNYSFTVYPACSSGTVSIPVLYEDNHQATSMHTLDFIINDNQAPAVNEEEKYFPVTKRLSAASVVQDSVSVNDADDDLLTYTWVNQPDEIHYGTFMLNPDGSFNYTVNEEVMMNHDDLFLIEISDGKYTVYQKLHFQITVESVTDGNETALESSIPSELNSNKDNTQIPANTIID